MALWYPPERAGEPPVMVFNSLTFAVFLATVLALNALPL